MTEVGHGKLPEAFITYYNRNPRPELGDATYGIPPGGLLHDAMASMCTGCTASVFACGRIDGGGGGYFVFSAGIPTRALPQPTHKRYLKFPETTALPVGSSSTTRPTSLPKTPPMPRSPQPLTKHSLSTEHWVVQDPAPSRPCGPWNLGTRPRLRRSASQGGAFAFFQLATLCSPPPASQSRCLLAPSPRPRGRRPGSSRRLPSRAPPATCRPQTSSR